MTLALHVTAEIHTAPGAESCVIVLHGLAMPTMRADAATVIWAKTAWWDSLNVGPRWSRNGKQWHQVIRLLSVDPGHKRPEMYSSGISSGHDLS